MYSGTQYSEEEKITRTDMVTKLLESKETVFTVTFRKKVDPSDIENALI
jgi:hypothetical protein